MDDKITDSVLQLICRFPSKDFLVIGRNTNGTFHSWSMKDLELEPFIREYIKELKMNADPSQYRVEEARERIINSLLPYFGPESIEQIIREAKKVEDYIFCK